jgi:membrane protein YdbS with pleckstrin-like domain
MPDYPLQTSRNQFTSPEADRKVVLWISIGLMIPFWIFLALMCLALWHEVFTESWDTVVFVIALFLSFLVVVGIPFQLLRYFRELRKLRTSK